MCRADAPPIRLKNRRTFALFTKRGWATRSTSDLLPLEIVNCVEERGRPCAAEVLCGKRARFEKVVQ